MAPFEIGLFTYLSLATVAVWGGVWSLRLARVWTPVGPSGRAVSLLLALLPSLVTALLFQDRAASELYTAGFSSQNIAQLLTTALVVGWAFWLLYSRRVPLSVLVSGPMFWVAALAGVYLTSTLWSIWKPYTLYRTVELAAFFVIAAHLFSHRQWYVWLHRFLLWSVVVTLASALLTNGLDGLMAGRVFAGLRSNTGGLVAAAFVLQIIHSRMFTDRRPPLWKFALGFAAFVLFGSLASVAAGLASLMILLTFKTGRRYRWLMGAAGTIGVLIAGYSVIFHPVAFTETYVEPIATASGKTPEMILTLTGRLPLWTAIYEQTRDKPVGQGFAAAERLFVVVLSDRSEIGWEARSAHSGYVSAWMGAGWLGFLSVIAIFLSVWQRSRHVAPSVMPLLLSLIILLAINNFTVVGVGGQFTPTWLLMLGLCCAPPVPQKRMAQHEANATHSQSQVITSLRGG